MTRILGIGLSLLASIGMAGAFQSATKSDYMTEIAKWREDRAKGLTQPTGWFAVAGLFWLKQGENSIGSDPKMNVPLPEGSVGASVGVLRLDGKKVTYAPTADAGASIGGKAIEGPTELHSDATDKPDRVKVGRLLFRIIERGDKIGVRLWDPESKGRKGFVGLSWYPASPKYVIKAKFVKFDKPKELMITNVLGQVAPVKSTGYVQFMLNGKLCKLQTEDQGDNLFINFADGTSGDTTYPPGRFLDTDLPKDGFVTIDFNKTYNPPCCFTSFATCPLPPKGNRLTVRLEAGEKSYQGFH